MGDLKKCIFFIYFKFNEKLVKLVNFPRFSLIYYTSISPIELNLYSLISLSIIINLLYLNFTENLFIFL